MKPAFYSMLADSPRGALCCALLALSLLLPACGAEPESATVERDDQQFAVGGVLSPYVPVPEGGMEDRLIEKLRTGSKEALRFAKEAIGARGEVIVPRLLKELRADFETGATTATNIMSALVFTQTKRTLPILVEIMQSHPLPLVRSQAIDTIAFLRQIDLEDALLTHAEIEVESGPAARIVPALAALGGDASVAYLSQLVGDWVEAEFREPRGQKAWEALLSIESEAARREINRWIDRLAPTQRAPGVTRLIHLGQTELAADVREYLNPEAYISAGVRHKAVEGLAAAGDFDGVMLAREDPDLRVRLAVIDSMRLEVAAKADFARGWLEDVARGNDEDMARAALAVLAERGDSSAIEPWLALVKGFPTQPRSSGATRMFLHSNLGHPALISLLIQRWPFCDTDQRIDLGRVMAAHADDTSIQFLLDVVMDEEANPDVRLYSITSIGNSGEIAIDALFQIWEAQPGPDATERVLNAFLRFPEIPRVREFLVSLATNPSSFDFARAHALAGLPKAYGEDSYPMLMQARGAAERDVVRRFIEEMLHEYF
ncbi:MAG: hypothetical protein MK209_02745 [Planctomycetes bacterium]|nr:hypothetical protein [Planctomycetota bacterium]